MDLLRKTVFFSGYLGPISSKITLMKRRKREKERARRKKGGEEKKAMAAPFFFHNGYFGRKKNCWTQKVHLAVTFSKICMGS